MRTQHQPTAAQKIFGSQFGDRKIINERPDGMPFGQYVRLRRQQTELIKQVTR